MIKREIQHIIERKLFKGKIIIIYGARRVGKTTLLQQIKSIYQDAVYYNCDERDVREAFTNKTSTEMKEFIGNKKFILLDEAQRIENIGLSLKLIIDNFPNIQIIATGSSAFELSNKIKEPLTGRKYEFYLYPFSYKEIAQIYSSLELDRILENRLIYGMYPDIVMNNNKKDLKEITESYLYKDALEHQHIKNSEILIKLLQALALQIGNEVSYNELSSIIGIDKNTIQRYIQILEKSFIIFRISPFSRNIRNELKKLRKIYFYDIGIRNALINNFNPLHLRNDVGVLWENFIISERMKYNKNNDYNKSLYFWRTTDTQKEIDYIEEYEGKLHAYELKWKEKKISLPKQFISQYNNVHFKVIHQKNYKKFLHI